MSIFNNAPAVEPDADPRAGWLTQHLLDHDDCATLQDRNDLLETIPPTREFADLQLDCAGRLDDSKLLEHIFQSFRSMDEQGGGFVDHPHGVRFLDTGRYMGGYGTYIMRRCSRSNGVGLSLGGGRNLAIPSDLRNRMVFHSADLASLDLAPGTHPYRLAPIPIPRRDFSFVAADADPLGLDSYSPNRLWSDAQLLVSQLLLALHGIHPGGTIFLKLSAVEHHLTARTLIALRRISEDTHTIKCDRDQPNRPTFHLLAEGVLVNSSECRKLVEGLEELWRMMALGDAYGSGVSWSDWDRIAPWDDVCSPEGVDLIARLGEHVWGIQAEALEILIQMGDGRASK